MPTVEELSAALARAREALELVGEVLGDPATTPAQRAVCNELYRILNILEGHLVGGRTARQVAGLAAACKELKDRTSEIQAGIERLAKVAERVKQVASAIDVVTRAAGALA